MRGLPRRAPPSRPSRTTRSRPTFANTIEALELAEQTLDRVAGVFFNIAGSDSNPAREALQRDLAPKLSAFSSEVTNNRALFQRIETLWQTRDSAGPDGRAGRGC